MLDRVDAGLDGRPCGRDPWACAAGGLRSRWASSTRASISAWVTWGESTIGQADSTPPEAMSLITSAPYLTAKRTASRKLSGPDAIPLLRPVSFPKRWRESRGVRVPAASAEGVGRDEHARAGDGARGDPVPQAHVHVVGGAEVADRREAREERLPREFGRADCLLGGGALEVEDFVPEIVGSQIHREVHVAVDEAGEQRRVPEVDDRRARGDGDPSADRLDLRAFDDDHGVRRDGVAAGVKEPLRLQDRDGCGWRLGGGERTGEQAEGDGDEGRERARHGILLRVRRGMLRGFLRSA